jgi:hypothetical protein
VSGSLCGRALLTSAALAVVLVQPLTAPPSYAGAVCDAPVPIPGDDCTAPETRITAQPEAETESRDATFAFTTEQPEVDVTFECRLAGPSQAHDWSDCTTPPQAGAATSEGSKSYTGLALGGYTFSVRATDAFKLGPNTEETPAQATWTIVEPDEPPPPPPPDTEDPDTFITNGADRWHPFSYIGVQYASDEDASGWECALNGVEQSCNDDQKNFLGMKAGDYVFTVAAVDGSDRVDPTPARERWSVPMNNTLFKTHSAEWDKRSGKGYFQDTYSFATERGAFIEQAKQGFKSLVLVATRCSGCGTVAVYLKDRLLKTIRLSAAATEKRQIIPVASWRAKHAGRVRLEVVSNGKDVIIEGLGFSARR